MTPTSDAPHTPPQKLTRSSLADIISAAPGGYDTCNRWSQYFNNLLLPKRRSRLKVTPTDILSVLRSPPTPEQQEIYRVLKMFLVMFVMTKNRQEMSSASQPDLESIARGSGETAETARFFMTEAEQVSETPHLRFLEGAIAYKTDQIANSFDAFNKARLLYERDWETYHHQLGVHAIRPLPEFLIAAKQDADLKTDFEFETSKGFKTKRPIIMIGVDQRYYDRYASQWIDTTEGKANLHFHVANPDQSKLQKRDHLRYSFETVSTPTPAYFATMRFLHLHHVLDRYGAPVIVSDADASLTGDPTILTRAANQQDLALTVSAGARDFLPWRHFIAQAVMARPTENAFDFLSCYRSLFAHISRSSKGPQWWIDQALITATLAVIRAQGKSPAVLCGRLLPAAGLQQNKH